MIYLRQSTASQEVPLGYFVDSTDGDTEETGLTIANTDIKLWKAGATTLANKNSGGATHISNGVYYAVLDATDTNTLGSLVIFVHVAGALAVKVDCVVLAANVYDSLIAGSDLLDVNTSQIGGTAQTGNDVGADVDAILADTGTDGVAVNWAATVNPTATVSLTNTTVAVVSAVTGLTQSGIADAVWDEATSGHVTAGTYGVAVTDILGDTNEMQPKFGTISDLGSGATLGANLADIEAQTDDIGAAGAGLTAVPWNAAWDVEVQSEVADALVAIGLDHLVSASVAGTDVADNSVIARLVSSSATADWDTYVNTTDSMQAIRDNQIAATDIVSGGAITTSGGAVSTVTNVGTVTGNVDGSVASVVGAVGSVAGNVSGSVGSVAGNVDGSVASVTATVSADVVSVSGSTAAADQLEAHALTAVAVTFSGGTTSTAVLSTVDGAAASGTDDRYNSRILVFNAGTLDHVVAQITDYDGVSKTATISTVPTAVTSSHTAILV